MTLKVDDTKWFTAQRIRPSADPVKVAEIEELGVLEQCAASAYSHAYLVPKPEPNTWRLTIDYTNLNRVTSQPELHPIANVNDMLQRIGQNETEISGSNGLNVRLPPDPDGPPDR